ncbi:MAG: hypothetical protein F4Y55_08005, partial [Gammaproteobacteria bacterium]|nr:hypothetical protein [Gammaproteobacteria bacterium]
MTLRFQRANFLVSSIERALPFYEDVLGFSVAFVKEPRAASYSHKVFGLDTSRSIGFATLSAPSQERVMALTEVPGLATQAAPRRSAIVIEVEDVDGVVGGGGARRGPGGGEGGGGGPDTPAGRGGG